MSPKQLGQRAVRTSTMTDRELIEGVFEIVCEMNGKVQSHDWKIKALWIGQGAMLSALVAIIALLGHGL